MSDVFRKLCKVLKCVIIYNCDCIKYIYMGHECQLILFEYQYQLYALHCMDYMCFLARQLQKCHNLFSKGSFMWIMLVAHMFCMSRACYGTANLYFSFHFLFFLCIEHEECVCVVFYCKQSGLYFKIVRNVSHIYILTALNYHATHKLVVNFKTYFEREKKKREMRKISARDKIH